MERVEITPEAQRVLATYFMMKAFVADQSRVGEVYFTQAERNAFYARRTIPDGIIVVIARFIPEPHPMVKAYFKEAKLRRSLVADVSLDPANFTFRVGSLFIQVLSLRKIEAQVEQRTPFAIRVFPPHGEKSFWPPNNTLTAFDAHNAQLLITLHPSG